MLQIDEIDIYKKDITVRELLVITEKKIDRSFIYKILDKKGKILRGTIILINGKNILHLDKLDSIVKDNDIVSLFPPGGGG